MLEIRNRFNTACIAKKQTLRRLLAEKKSKRLFVVGFMSDQKPSHGDPDKILDFFGRPTAVITGTETLARRLNTAVVYWKMEKPSRGRYKITVCDMSNCLSDYDGCLTLKYFDMLQQNITENPSIWLWSHNRWKTSPADWADVNPETLLGNE